MQNMLVLSKDANLDVYAAIGILLLVLAIRFLPALRKHMHDRHS